MPRRHASLNKGPFLHCALSRAMQVVSISSNSLEICSSTFLFWPDSKTPPALFPQSSSGLILALLHRLIIQGTRPVGLSPPVGFSIKASITISSCFRHIPFSSALWITLIKLSNAASGSLSRSLLESSSIPRPALSGILIICTVIGSSSRCSCDFGRPWEMSCNNAVREGSCGGDSLDSPRPHPDGFPCRW